MLRILIKTIWVGSKKNNVLVTRNKLSYTEKM